MGYIKKMVEQEIPGIYVLSVMIGKNVVEVTSHCRDALISENTSCEENELCISHTVTSERFKWTFYAHFFLFLSHPALKKTQVLPLAETHSKSEDANKEPLFFESHSSFD